MADGKRKKLVIEPTIQYSLVRQLVFHWITHLAATLLLVGLLQVLLGGFFRPLQYHIDEIWPTMASLVITLLFLLPIYIQSSLKLSNRFVGPIHRLRGELRRLSEDPSYRELKFREGDYWEELSGEFEGAVTALQQGRPALTATPPETAPERTATLAQADESQVS